MSTGTPTTILGLIIDQRLRAAIIAELREWLSEREPHHVVTVNPELLVAAQRDAVYRDVLASADLRLADGAGVLLAARVLKQPIPERFTGVELVDELAELAAQLGRSVYLVGGEPGIAEAAAAELQRRHPTLRIAGAEEGVPKLRDPHFAALEPDRSESAVVARIAAARPAVLLVAYGHPKQEQFIHQYRNQLGASVLVGVGGTFDFLAGRVPRAPQWLRALWLEWLWRLVIQPWRITRIWNATVVFLWLIVRERLSRSK